MNPPGFDPTIRAACRHYEQLNPKGDPRARMINLIDDVKVVKKAEGVWGDRQVGHLCCLCRFNMVLIERLLRQELLPSGTAYSVPAAAH